MYLKYFLKILDGWDETPRHYIRLDVRSLLQDAAIEDVSRSDPFIFYLIDIAIYRNF